MCPERKRPPALGLGRAASNALGKDRKRYTEFSRSGRDDQDFTEFLTAPERAQVREVWWRLRRAGVHLPAERGIVTLDGGAK